jgi:hypothetical protein
MPNVTVCISYVSQCEPEHDHISVHPSPLPFSVTINLVTGGLHSGNTRLHCSVSGSLGPEHTHKMNTY